MNENLSSKRYEPPVINLKNKNSSHTLIIESIGFNKKVLEIGTSTGYISKILAERGNRVTGIEIDEEVGSIAQDYCDQMIIGDVETLDLNESLKSASFDVIICGDVLEHLKKPAATLEKLQKFLRPEGYLVVSLPNFCHGDVLLNLLNGDFHYTSVGLLDETHLHFFGLKNIYSVFAACGYQIKDLQTTNYQIGNTELKVDDTKIPNDLIKFIRSLPDSDVYQYIFNAYPSDCVTVPVIQEINLKQSFFDSLQESRKEVEKPLEAKIDSLNLSLSERETHILELTIAKDTQIRELTIAKDTQIRELTIAKDTQIRELTIRLIEKEQKLSAIEKSIVWQLTMKFHNKIIERLFPQNTKRRAYYDLGLKKGRIFCYKDRKKPDQAVPLENLKYQKKSDNLKVSLESELFEHLNSFLSDPHKRLIFPGYESPVVSIIILTFNKSAYTCQCLESLLENTDIPYEIILVDNRSTDETGALLKKVDNIVQIVNSENLGFIRGCNEGAKNARGKYLLFLNNDTVVTKKWLSCLVTTMENNPDCGAVGCKLVWPNGQLQEAGSIIWKDGSASGYGRGDDPVKPEYSYLREIDFCSGACLLVRTDLFKILKGFDERYIPAYYEDADLCLGIQNLGYKVIYQPKVTIFHHEFTSSSKAHAIQYMINNQSKFIEKWQEHLKTKEINSPDSIVNARDIRTGKKILVIDDRIPASNQGSGYPRANLLLRYVGELGFKVTFFPIADTTPWQPYTSQFQDLGIEVFFGDPLNFEEFSRKRSNFYDIIIVSRPHNFEKTFQTLKLFFPNAFIVYDAEALFSSREILKAEIEGVPLDDNSKKTLRAKEFELMKKAGMIITVSENEKKMILESGGIKNVIVFGYPVQVQKTIAGFDARKDILFVGSFLARNGPNDDAILYFVKDIWPIVQKKLHCKLFIVGINPPNHILELASESITVTGFVPFLEEYYNNCRVFIVPHRYAAGIPLKLIEAMSYGIPSVVSALIGKQLNLSEGKEVLIAKDSHEFAEKIIRIYQNDKLWEEIQRNSIDYLLKNNNPETIKKSLDNAIKSSRDDA